MTAPAPGRIRREDIEAKLRQLKGEAQKTQESAGGPLALVGGAVAFGLLSIAFLLGKRKGKRVSTTVEIRRV